MISRFTYNIEKTSGLIRIDKENPENSGSLIRKREQLCSRNARNRSLLKDLKKIEDEYIALENTIQEQYVYQTRCLKCF